MHAGARLNGAIAAGLLAAVVLAVPAAGLAGPRTVRSDVVLAYEREGDERAVIEGYLSAEGPDRLRLATHFGFFKAFDLTARGDSFWVAVPRFGAVLAGRKDQVRVTPLDPGRLTQALFLDPLGGPPGDADTVTDSTGARVAGRDSLGTWELRLNPAGRPLRFTRRHDSGEQFLEVDFERYAEVQGGGYPRRIRWTDPERRQTLTMEFGDVRLDSGMDGVAFGPPPDSELKVVPWTSWEEIFSARPR
ncbi:MAG: hypothetical protein HZB25_03315 [Candidatus Eisenbacteria bacterium]|nr:hypothetical protein [Candidatus Eisenbacteria bacterium]